MHLEPLDGGAEPLVEGYRLDVGEQPPEPRLVGLGIADVAWPRLGVAALERAADHRLEPVDELEQRRPGPECQVHRARVA